MARGRGKAAANGLLTAFVVGKTPARRRLRRLLLVRSRNIVRLTFAWRLVRRIMVGKPQSVRTVKTRRATIEVE